MTATTHAGGCLCGAVRYAAHGPLREVVFCHCSQCRRQTGLAYAATAVAQADLTITEGTALRWFQSSTFARRGFCGICGSALFWWPSAGTHVSILAGSLDDPSPLSPGYHICTDRRPAFLAALDSLPCHAGSAPGLVIAGSVAGNADPE